MAFGNEVVQRLINQHRHVREKLDALSSQAGVAPEAKQNLADELHRLANLIQIAMAEADDS